uniref:non-specific serine/threonine protein kinase n=1 Tax=Cyprinus carpio TaxID=7962 RepID=A0A8C2Q871_CYPCA
TEPGWEMETVGKFEFSRKDLIGHGAFAVVFKGRHREKHDWEVAVKCINKKNLAKSQTLLGKEIKILKVRFGCIGTKGTLSEDTIRVFLQQIAGAMRVLQAKGIIHRDLKPQNILLSLPAGRKSHSNNTCIKIADFGFARYLQNNMMAATLCGSPMYMAPEVIMSQNYDAKADLWSIGTIVFQCLTGKAPFQASSPQDLRLFYEKNKTLSPNIPRETSSHLRHLLLGLLQRNHKDRMDFGQYPECLCPLDNEAMFVIYKFRFVTVTCFPSSASASSCSSSSTSHLASPPQSLAEIQQVRAKALASPTQDSPGYLLKDSGGGGGGSKNSSCDTDDFVMVPAHFPKYRLCSQGKTPPRSPSYSSSPGPSGRPSEFSGSNYGNYGQSVPIPVPTQIHNYQRMEQNLQFPGQEGSPQSGTVQRCGSGSFLACGRTGPSPPQSGSALTSRRLSTGGVKPFQLSPQGEGRFLCPNPYVMSLFYLDSSCTLPVCICLETKAWPQQHGLGTRLNSAPCLLEAAGGCRQKIRKQHSDPVVAPQGNVMPFRTLHSSPRLSELMQRNPLPTILGSPSRLVSSPSFETEPLIQADTTAPVLCIPSCFYFFLLFCFLFYNLLHSSSCWGRSQSVGRLSDVLLMAAFGGQRGERGSMDNLNSDRAIDITAPSGGGGFVVGSGSPARVVFTVGSPPSGGTPPQSSRSRKFSAGSSSSISPVGSLTSRYPQTGICIDGYEGSSSPRYGFTDPISAVTFEAPELPEETLMEQEHTETLRRLRFMLDFARCVVEVAGARGGEAAQADLSSTSLLQQQSLVADQISSLSREWSYAEQLVLYMKIAELLSSSLHTAMEGIKQGKLYPSTTVKQVVRRLNDLYKSSVMSCRSLSAQLERFFSRKHKLMDHINSITAERLLFSHSVQMVQAAALDEMFHQGEVSVQRYHKALLLMEGLCLLLTEQADILSINKCKQCIERRLTALQSGLCV